MLSRIPRRLLLNNIKNINKTNTTSRPLASRLPPPPPSPPLQTRPFTSSPTVSSSTPMAAQTDTNPPLNLTPESLTSTLQSKISTAHVQIQDMSGGCGQAFTAVIVSDEFKGKSALQRHRLVNGALKEEIAAIHAWTPRCLTVEQWEKEKGRD